MIRLRKNSAACLLACWLCLLAGPVGAAQAASEPPDAKAIMARALEQNTYTTFSAEMEMVLIDQGGGQRVRRMRLFSKRQGQVRKRAVFFQAPPDIRGTAFLSISSSQSEGCQDQTEQWIFLPALGKVKRIASGDARQSFMGSDLSYGDMAHRGLDGFNFSLLRSDQVRGQPVWLIEARPATPDLAEELGYSRAVYLVRQDNHAVVRAINWLLTGNRMRYLDVLKMEQINGLWTPLEVQVWTTGGDKVLHKTILRSSEVKVDQELPDELFSQERLEKGL